MQPRTQTVTHQSKLCNPPLKDPLLAYKLGLLHKRSEEHISKNYISWYIHVQDIHKGHPPEAVNILGDQYLILKIKDATK